MSSLPVSTPRADCGCGVALVYLYPWNEHVTGGAAGVGEVTFLQNHYRIPHVAVHGVNPEVGVCQRPPPVALSWTLQQPVLPREGDPIYHGVWGGGGVPLRDPTQPMLGLAV